MQVLFIYTGALSLIYIYIYTRRQTFGISLWQTDKSTSVSFPAELAMRFHTSDAKICQTASPSLQCFKMNDALWLRCLDAFVVQQ